MTTLVNNPFLEGWIVRLFREARADLSASFNMEDPFISANLIVQSMKKLQKVIFFCLGAPEGLQEISIALLNTQNALCEWVLSLQSVISYWIQRIISLENINLENLLSDAKLMFEFSTCFFDNFLEEKSKTKIGSFPEKF